MWVSPTSLGDGKIKKMAGDVVPSFLKETVAQYQQLLEAIEAEAKNIGKLK
jgi:hypothetical protein